MYRRMFKGVGHVMGFFFKPYERCCEKDDHRDEGEGKKCGRGCNCMPCRKKDDEDTENTGKKSTGRALRSRMLTNVLKCMFDASDIDYDYED